MRRAISYLHYRIRSGSKYHLHSPFIYELWSRIIKDRSHYHAYHQVSTLRTKLRNDNGYIKMCDLGARSSEVVWCRKIMKIRKIAKASSVSPRYGKLLFRLVQYFKPQTILEMGTSLGLSTCYLSLGNPDALITTIEGCPETAEVAERNFRIMGMNNIRQLTGSFDEVLPAHLPEMGKIDMVFIDGNHRLVPTLKYFELILKHIHENSVIVFDDIHWSEEMEKAWEVIRKNPAVKVSVDLFQMGLLFFREGLSKEDFVISY